MFNIPYYYPGFNPGIQIVNLQQGGPSSHMGALANAPRVTPTVYAVMAKGLGFGGAAMPRQVIGVTMPSTSNNLSYPNTRTNLQIQGLFKNPTGG
jgi:hypothetical protein